MSESALLRAVRDQLRASPVSYTNAQCEIELDTDELPAAVGDKYIAVLPAGWVEGPEHRSGGVKDYIYSIDVAVILRSTRLPRDRKRDTLYATLSGLNYEINRISNQIDFKYAVNTAANVIILADESSSEGFIEPLGVASVDAKPTPVPSEWFAGVAGEPQAGLMRVIHFHGARRIVTRT